MGQSCPKYRIRVAAYESRTMDVRGVVVSPRSLFGNTSRPAQIRIVRLNVEKRD